jgi:hypothetical protein
MAASIQAYRIWRIEQQFMPIVGLIALFFSIMAIRLMMAIENAQIVIVGGLEQISADRAIALAIGVHKLALMKMSIILFTKVSMIIFSFQGLYPEMILQRAATIAMNTTLTSDKGTIVSRYNTTKKEKRRENETRERVTMMVSCIGKLLDLS